MYNTQLLHNNTRFTDSAVDVDVNNYIDSVVEIPEKITKRDETSHSDSNKNQYIIDQNIIDQNIINEVIKNNTIFNFKKDNQYSNIDHFNENINWIGYIESIQNTTIYAKIKQLEVVGPDEYAEFEMDDVSSDDKEFVKEGAVFYYSIGYASIKGQRIKSAMLKFKRNVCFTTKDVDEISNKVAALEKGIRWE